MTRQLCRLPRNRPRKRHPHGPEARLEATAVHRAVRLGPGSRRGNPLGAPRRLRAAPVQLPATRLVPDGRPQQSRRRLTLPARRAIMLRRSPLLLVPVQPRAPRLRMFRMFHVKHRLKAVSGQVRLKNRLRRRTPVWVGAKLRVRLRLRRPPHVLDVTWDRHCAARLLCGVRSTCSSFLRIQQQMSRPTMRLLIRLH